MKDTLVNSVRKAMNLLDILIFEDFCSKGISLSELSRKTGIKTNTLHNLLKTMVACGYVQQNEDSKYLAGIKCSNIGIINRIRPGSKGLQDIEVILEEYMHELEESVVFTILADSLRVPLLRIEHNSPVKVDYAMLESDNIYEKDTGKILTCYADAYSFNKIKEKWGYPGQHWEGIEDEPAFDYAIKKLHKQGYSKSIVGDGSIISIAVPVLDKNKVLIGALGSYAPVFRCDQEKQKAMIDKLKECALRIADKNDF